MGYFVAVEVKRSSQEKGNTMILDSYKEDYEKPLVSLSEFDTCSQ